MRDRRERLIGAWLAVLAGLVLAVMVWLQPGQLRVPAWVVYAVCAVIVFAGLALFASALGHPRAHAWLVAVCLGAMVLPGAWIAIGPGPRFCGFSIGFMGGISPEPLCRAAFGLGTLVVVPMLMLAVRMAIRASRGAADAA
jgi:hypothetical protein